MSTQRPGAKPPASAFAIWYETTLKRYAGLLGTIALAALVVILLQSRGANALGVIAGGGYLVGLIYFGLSGRGASPYVDLSGRTRALIAAFAVLWAAAALYPFVRLVYPGAELANLTLSNAHADRDFRYTSRLPLVFLVHANFRPGSGDADAEYSFTVSRGDRSHSVTGTFERTHQTRRGRRGASQSITVVSTVDTLRQFGPNLGRGDYRMHLEEMDDTLQDELHVQVYPAPYPMWAFWAAAALLLLLAMPFDALLSRRGHKSYVSACVAVTMVFVYFAMWRVTPDALSTSVLGGVVVSFVVGGSIGGILGLIARNKLGPRFAKVR